MPSLKEGPVVQEKDKPRAVDPRVRVPSKLDRKGSHRKFQNAKSGSLVRKKTFFSFPGQLEMDQKRGY